MKWHFMKRQELLEFLTYLPWSLRNKLLKKEEWKWDTLYNGQKLSDGNCQMKKCLSR